MRSELASPTWPDLCWKGGVKYVVRKINRSNIYHLLNTIIPINHKQKAESDALGIVIILGLIVGVVSLVRLVLDCTH